MRVDVHCYSGRMRDERPVRFQLDGHRYMFEEVLDQWCGGRRDFQGPRGRRQRLVAAARDSALSPMTFEKWLLLQATRDTAIGWAARNAVDRRLGLYGSKPTFRFRVARE